MVLHRFIVIFNLLTHLGDLQLKRHNFDLIFILKLLHLNIEVFLEQLIHFDI